MRPQVRRALPPVGVETEAGCAMLGVPTDLPATGGVVVSAVESTDGVVVVAVVAGVGREVVETTEPPRAASV